MGPGFFDFDQRLQRLSDIGDQLEAYSAAVALRRATGPWQSPVPPAIFCRILPFFGYLRNFELLRLKSEIVAVYGSQMEPAVPDTGHLKLLHTPVNAGVIFHHYPE